MVGIVRDAQPEAKPGTGTVAPGTAPEPGRVDGADALGPTVADAATAPAVHASLPIVALVLGIAGVVLGITVIWFFAAIPVGIVSVAVGLFARARIASYDDVRAAPRATIGTALGCVAILLGVTGAYFLPRAIDRADRFLGTVQQDVNEDVNEINGGLSRDVDRLDRTLSRDLRRFEAQNRQDLNELEQRSTAALAALEVRLNGDVAAGSAALRRDLTQLENQLQQDLAAIEAAMRKSDDTLHDTFGGLEARITKIEQTLGL